MPANAAPATPPSQRYVSAAAQGMLHWLSPQTDGVARAFYHHLVLAGQPVALDVEALATQLGQPPKAIAKALFTLLRENGLHVSDHAPAVAAPSLHVSKQGAGLAELAHDLAALAQTGQSLMLSTEDGLCIACIGWNTYESDVMAVRVVRGGLSSPAESWPLRLHGRPLYLSASSPLQRNSPLLLQLARRLLACLSSVE